MCRIASGVAVGASHGLDLGEVAPPQRKALERRQKQRLRKRYFRALDAGREPPEAALSMVEQVLHKVPQPREQFETQHSGTIARQAPLVQTVDAVVTITRQVPCASPPKAPVTPPIQVVEMEPCSFLQPLSFAPMPMLLCAVQDVRPVSERMAVPMVMVDSVPAVPKDGQGVDLGTQFERQLEEVPREMPVASVSQRTQKTESPHDSEFVAERECAPQRLVLPYTVKNTFIEVQEPHMDDDEGMCQEAEGRARRNSRAQSAPARRCR